MSSKEFVSLVIAGSHCSDCRSMKWSQMLSPQWSHVETQAAKKNTATFPDIRSAHKKTVPAMYLLSPQDSADSVGGGVMEYILTSLCRAPPERSRCGGGKGLLIRDLNCHDPSLAQPSSTLAGWFGGSGSKWGSG